MEGNIIIILLSWFVRKFPELAASTRDLCWSVILSGNSEELDFIIVYRFVYIRRTQSAHKCFDRL